MSKCKKLVNFSAEMMADLEHICSVEDRNFSELIRECVRQYIIKFRTEHGDNRTIGGLSNIGGQS